jgi:hypothetical protein
VDSPQGISGEVPRTPEPLELCDAADSSSNYSDNESSLFTDPLQKARPDEALSKRTWHSFIPTKPSAIGAIIPQFTDKKQRGYRQAQGHTAVEPGLEPLQMDSELASSIAEL